MLPARRTIAEHVTRSSGEDAPRPLRRRRGPSCGSCGHRYTPRIPKKQQQLSESSDTKPANRPPQPWGPPGRENSLFDFACVDGEVAYTERLELKLERFPNDQRSCASF